MSRLSTRRILLGISGGIAAYKAAELTRLLKKAGAEVRVVMTAGAQQFITPLTLQALSGEPVRTELFDDQAEAAMGHIELARWADAVVIAPASANTLARLAEGKAEDLLSTLVLASESPLFLCPAMNRVMWSKDDTQEHLKRLIERAAVIIGPDDGEQACGEVGAGRLMEPEAIAATLEQHFAAGPLAGKRVMVTAGPTREAIDPVRYLSNRSSGKMGYALAQAAYRAGAEVLLVSGPTALTPPRGVEHLPIVSADELAHGVMQRLDGIDLFIGAAAVADYSPASSAPQKIKKHDDELQLTLVKTRDVITEVAARSPRPVVVGFAAETEQLEQHARDKLQRKGLDMICANPVDNGQGFDRDDNRITAYWPDGAHDLGSGSKQHLADALIDLISTRYFS